MSVALTANGPRPAATAGQAVATRTAYRDRLLELVPQRPRLICLDTDTGLFSPAHAADLGRQYVNIGIAEHTMMGMAAGLAAAGRLPFVNTMAAFAASRALEAVKIDIAYNGLPVRIAATHGGLAAGHLGPTHQALEDLAVMRVLPGMTVVVPADAHAAAAAVDQSLELAGPLYLRLGRKATPPLPAAAEPMVIGRAQTLREGGDAVLACCGPYPVLACLQAARQLAAEGVSCTVLNLHTLSPLDTDALVRAADRTDLVVCVEEHWRGGGLGGAVAEALSEAAPTRVLRIGMPDRFADVSGDHLYLLTRYGITAERVARSVREGLGLEPAETHPRSRPTPLPRKESDQ